ncbi:MAG: glycosyltransferase family 2 protein [Planctomycetota bacterium]
MERPALSIVVPVYNERDSVPAAVERFKEIVRAVPGGAEVILVDDGSNDGTENLLNGLAVEGMRVLRHPWNRGYGAALKSGLAAAAADFVAITDADGTYPDDRLPELFAEMRRHPDLDMVVGARTGPNARIPLLRRPAKWCLNKLANLLSRQAIPDLNSGLRIMRKSVVEKFLRILPDGFSFTTTITLAMLTNGRLVKYLPIEYRRRVGRSKIRPVYDTLDFLQLILRTTLYFNPLRIFLPLSLFIFLSAFVVAAGSRLLLGRVMDVTFGVLVMAAIMVFAIGLLADLIDKRL